MDPIKYALDMENETKNYYLELANKCVEHKGVKNILKMLAQEHEKHSDTFKQIDIEKNVEMEDNRSFQEVDKLFKLMKEEKKTFSCDIDQVDLYKKALNLVEKKYNFYSELLESGISSVNKEMIARIAKEEKHQKYVLENIVEMVTRPDDWVENAEFYHFEEY